MPAAKLETLKYTEGDVQVGQKALMPPGTGAFPWMIPDRNSPKFAVLFSGSFEERRWAMIGGASEVKQMIADLQAALLELGTEKGIR